MKQTHIITTSLIFAFSLVGLNAQIITYTFDDPADVGTFTGSGSNFSAGSGNGLNGSDSLTFGGSDSSFTLTAPSTPLSFDFSGDLSFTQSTYFQVGSRTQFGRDNRRGLYLGVVESGPAILASNPFLTNPAISGGIFINEYNASGTGEKANASFGALGSNPSNVPGNVGSFDLVFENWYFLEVEFSYSSSNDNWTLDFTLNNSDGLGQIGSLIATETSGVLANGIPNVNALSGYIYSQGGARTNISVIDNASFIDGAVTTPVPEPSTYALIASVLAIGMVINRRRKN